MAAPCRESEREKSAWYGLPVMKGESATGPAWPSPRPSICVAAPSNSTTTSIMMENDVLWKG